MEITVMILISISLAMDCFAVAISAGTTGKNFTFKNLLLMALFFGVFQGAMTFIGWIAGTGFKSLIENFDHWIAFGLLLIIGVKMLKEGFENLIFRTSSELDLTNQQSTLNSRSVFAVDLRSILDQTSALHAPRGAANAPLYWGCFIRFGDNHA